MVTILLADAAQSVDGKLYILGGGWSVMAVPPVPTAVALHIRVPWDSANHPHRLLLELLDIDGEPVRFQTPVGEQAIRVAQEFEVGRPAGHKPGASIDLSLAINLAPLPLQPGGAYEWRLSIDDETREEWRAPFTVANQPSLPYGALA